MTTVTRDDLISLAGEAQGIANRLLQAGLYWDQDDHTAEVPGIASDAMQTARRIESVARAVCPDFPDPS